jgi:hypothetical protein
MFFLADDTIEIREQYPLNCGRRREWLLELMEMVFTCDFEMFQGTWD